MSILINKTISFTLEKVDHVFSPGNNTYLKVLANVDSLRFSI